MNGSPQESYLGLAAEEIRALVEFVDGSLTDGPRCSGAFVAPAWVVTAAHCRDFVSPEVMVRSEAQTDLVPFRVVRQEVHPTRDVALLKIDLSPADAGLADAGAPGPAPLKVPTADTLRLAVGDVVEMAGYGITSSSGPGTLRFLAESITQIDATVVTVDGFGATGACDGDSGGPLLVRATDGAVVVAGVLSTGSSSCRDHDNYIRLDSVQDWVTSVVEAYVPRTPTCGTISEQGRCLYGSALWCSSGTLSAQSCAAGTRCGWDPKARGFRCVDPLTDPCEGVDSVGACAGGAARWCTAGLLEGRTCAPCYSCRVDGTTGGPSCAPPSDGG